MDPTIPEEDSSFDTNITTNDVTPQANELAAPVITLKKGDTTIQSGATVANRADDVEFSITAVDGVNFYYTLDESAPTKNSTAYSAETTVPAPAQDTEKTVTIKAIAYKAASVTEGQEGYVAEQTSAVASATVVFAAKKNTIKLAEASTDVTIKVGETALSTTEGVDLDPANDLSLTVKVEGETAKTQELDKVQYKNADANVSDWKDATAAANGTYTIPKADLTTDLVVKAVLKNMPKVTFALAADTDSSYAMFTVKLTVKKGTTTLKNAEELELTNEKKDVSIPSGTVVTAVIEAKKKCQLTKVLLGDTDVPITNNTKANVTVSTTTKPFTADATITVTAAEGYLKAIVAPKTQGTGEASETTAKIWSVAPRAEYVISGVKAADGAFKIGKAELDPATVDGVTLEAMTETQGSDDDATEVPTGIYLLKVTEAAGGKQAKVKLFATEEVTTPVDTITVNVAPVITTVTVAKATGTNQDTITQSIGTTGTYALTLAANEKTSKDALAAAIKADTNTSNLIKEVKIENNNLVIATNAIEFTDTTEAVVQIKNTSMTDQTKTVIKEIKVKPAAPVWADREAPAVKLTSATDIVLNLALTLPKGVDKTAPEGTKYYYKVTPVVQPTTKKDGFTYNEGIKYVEASVADVTTQEALKVIEKDFGQGTDAKFDVTVQLLQYTVAADNDDDSAQQADSDKPAGMDKLIASSKAVTVKGLATKAPYYADKISLKKEKAASNLYTGQTAVVATVDFGKNTTYNRDSDVRAWVGGNNGNTSGNNKISVKTSSTGVTRAGDDLTVVNGQVTLEVGKDVAPGKYTVYVEQIAEKGIPEGAIQAKASLQVTVVQGIKTIEAQSVPKIYVAANKAGSAKITPVYNGGDAAKKPKTAKVNYTLGTVDQNDDFTAAAPGSDLAGWVTVKNGNVTVKKGYAAGTITDDTFAVKVSAADFDGNEAADVAEFEISTTELTLGNIVLVKAVTGDSGTTYKKLDTANAIPKEQVAGGAAQIRVLKSDVTKRDDYAAEDFVEDGLYALTFSKKSDIGIGNDGNIWVTKPVDKVKVSAMTTDGNKKNATDLVFSVTYETADDVRLQYTSGAMQNYSDFTDGAATVTGSTSEVIHVQAFKTIENGTASIYNHLVDYKVSVSGAKIVDNHGDKNNLYIDIVMNKKEAVLKLTNQKGKNPVEYKITNANFDAKKAPKVTLAKGTTFYAKYDAEQTLTFNVDKWDTNKNGDSAQVKKIKVTAAPDEASQTLYDLIKDDASKTITFTPSTTAAQQISIPFKTTKNVAGIKNGILRFDFVGENGAVVTQTSADVKISTALLKKSYKLTNKYNMSEKDAAHVKLAASGKPAGVAKKTDSEELDVTFTGILNANIKGKVNQFKNAFSLNSTTGVLSLVDKDLAVKDYGKAGTYKGINNLIGFVTYTVKYEDGTSDTVTTQITVNIDVAKNATINGLKTAAKPVMTASDMEPEIAVINSKKAPVKLVYAEYADKTGKIFEVNTDVAYTNGTVILKRAENASVPAAGKLEGTLTVIPEDSMYAAEAKAKYEAAKAESPAEGAEAAWNEILGKAKIELSVKIEVKAITTANKVKVESKDSKPSFKDVTESSGTYTVKVPYTVAVSAGVSNIVRSTEQKNGKDVSPAWITFAKADGENAVNISINKAQYVAAVKAGTKDSKGKYTLNGKAVDAVAVVTYTTAEAKTDTLKFKVTPPTLTNEDLESAVTPDPDEETYSVTVSPETASVAKGGTQAFTATVKKGQTEVQNATVTWSVAAASDGGNMTADTKFNANNNDANVLTVASEETATKLTVTATYTPAGGTAVTGTATVTVQ